MSGSGILVAATLRFKHETDKGQSANHKVWQLLVLLLGVAACTIILRNRIPLLGDGFLRMKEITDGRLFSVTEPLTTLVHGLFYRLILHIKDKFDSANLSYMIISISTGLIVTILYYFIARKWFQKSKWLGIAFLLGLGLNQIFYGYVESYALFMLGVWCYLWFGIRTLDKKTQPWTATISCSFAIACHAAGIFLMPSLGYLWWETLIRNKTGNWHKILVHVLILLAGPALAFSPVLVLAGQEQFSAWLLGQTPQNIWLPFWQGFTGNGIISFTHLADVLNQLLLIIPGALFILLISLLTGRTVEFDAHFKFLLSAVSGSIIFILVTDPQLGARRDWDLFAWVGIPIVMLALFLLKDSKNYKTVLVPAAILSMWLSWPWIGLNASEDLSVRRYTDILSNETKQVSYGYESLVSCYEIKYQKDKDRWVGKYKWACTKALGETATSPESLYIHAVDLIKKGEIYNAAIHLRVALLMDPTNVQYWNAFGAVLVTSQRYDEALLTFDRSLELDSGNADALCSKGVVHYQLANWTAADSFFLLARKHGYDSGEFYLCWGDTQLHLGRFENAIKSFELATNRGIRPSIVDPLYAVAVSELKKKRVLP